MRGIVNRFLSIKENYSGAPINPGTPVYSYDGHTYGCISPDGIAVTFDGKEPFFEVPANSVTWGSDD